jgi:hypothetical protein
VVYSATMRIALAKAFGVAAVTHIIGLVFAGGFTLFLRSLYAVVG